MYWASGRPSGKYPSGSWHPHWGAPCNPPSSVRNQLPNAATFRCEAHGACIRHQHWGFFNFDVENDGHGASTSTDIIGCPFPGGHGGNVIGFGNLKDHGADTNRRDYSS